MSVDVVAAKENATVIEIATRLAFNGVPIINDSGSVTGIITAIPPSYSMSIFNR